MRRAFCKGICAITFFFLLISPLSIAVSAEATEEVKVIPDEYASLLDQLPEEVRELLPGGFFSADADELYGAIGEVSDLSYLLQTALSLLGLHIGRALRLLASLVGILLLSALCRTVQSSFKASGVANAFSLCTTLVMLTLLLGRAWDTISRVTEYFHSLNAVTASAIPLMGALYAMGGNVSAAVATSSSLTVFITLLEGFIAKSIVPFCGICLAFTTVGVIDPSIRLGALLSSIKKNYTTALTFLMMLLLTMLSSQTILGARADTLAMKSVKFATGNLLPVLGGSVAELLRSISASIGYLRGTVGIAAVLLLMFLLLPTLMELFLMRLAWLLSASVAELLGCDSEKKLLEEQASVHGYLLAAVCICSSVLIIAFVLLVNCASAIG